MPHSETAIKRTARGDRKAKKRPSRAGSRYTVGLAPTLANQVARYAQTVDTSMSKAIAALVRIGLENQEDRKRDFFRRLKENLANDDPDQQDRLVDEFRTLILGRGSMPKIQWERLLRGGGSICANAQKSDRSPKRVCSNWASGRCRIPTCRMASGTRTSEHSSCVAMASFPARFCWPAMLRGESGCECCRQPPVPGGGEVGT